jgi:hypothetical protein
MAIPTLAEGPPPLTVEAADAALDEIDFIAAAVRGVDTIDATGIVKRLWRDHLTLWYPRLPTPTREWYAGAPGRLVWLRTQFPLMPPPQRAMLLQQWAAELPSMLEMLDPVLAQAQAQQAHDEQTRAHILKMLAEMRQQVLQASQSAPTPAPPAPSRVPASDAASIAAINELRRRADMSVILQNHATRMTALTLGQMRAINRR